MRSRFALLGVILIVGLVRADSGTEEDLFLALPGAVSLTPSWDEDPVLEELPSALLKLLSHYDWGESDGSVPKKVRGFASDLKRNGEKAFFIANPVMSGTGGTGYIVFYRFADRWREIGELQGSLYIYPTQKGTWPMIVSVARGGADCWFKSFSAFTNRKYHETALQNFDRGTVSWEAPRTD